MTDFLKVLPEICIALTLVFVVLGEITYYGEKYRLLSTFAVMGLGCALIQVLISYEAGHSFAFSGALSIDGLSLFFKFLFIVLGGFAVLSVAASSEIPPSRRAEFYSLVLGSCLAMCLAAGSAELLLSFVALLCLNALCFLLAGFGKDSILSAEAGVKYLVFSAVAGACFLYASGILFSATHTLDIYDIHRALVAHPLSRNEMIVVFLLFFVALGFQTAAFPMSLWAPDVIEGAPTPISGFISVGVPAAGFAVAIRLFLVTFTQSGGLYGVPGQWQVLGDVQWNQILTLLSGITMVFGALLAIRQTSAKRLVGCLIVSQTGFFLMGLLVMDEVGVAALLYNLVVELFAVIGVFYVLAFFFDQLGSDQLSDLKGVLTRAVPECICLVLFLLCVVGIPPMPGFLGKFTLIGSVIRHEQTALASVAIFSMALATIAVARLAFSLVGTAQTEPAAGQQWVSPYRNFMLASILIPMCVVGVFAQFFLDWAGRSLGFIFW